jgi:SapC protein
MSPAPRLELLSPDRHRQLRLRRLEEAAPHFVQIVTSEFAAAAASCPILFSKDPATGEFYAAAVFGFKPGESFFDDLRSRGGFTPLTLQRDGFFISGEHISIDRNNPRFSATEGERLFDEARLPSVSLRSIQRSLGELQAGLEQTKAFIHSLTECDLIEAIDIGLTFNGGEHLALRGLYTVSLDALRELDDATALRLFRSGHLQLACIVSASLKQIPILAQLRDRLIRRLFPESHAAASHGQ